MIKNKTILVTGCYGFVAQHLINKLLLSNNKIIGIYNKKYQPKIFKVNNIYNKNLLIKKTNIKYLIKSWYIHVTTIYYEQIMKGDISFFLNKDYSEEKKNVSKEYIDSFEKSVIFLKNIYETLEPELLHIFLDYIKKITYYSYLYYKK